MTGKSENNKTTARPGAKMWVRVLKAVLLTVLGAALFVAGILICTVSILTPDRLTPLVERVAGSQMDYGRLEADRVELKMRASFPFLQLDISNLRILSSAIDSLAPQARAGAPAWADTVLTVESFSGGLNVAKLALNKLEFSDVTITRPALSYVVVNDSVSNLSIMKADEEKPDEPFDWKSLPGVSIKRFAIEAPMPVRYYDIATGTGITAHFEHAWIDGNKNPLYKLRFDGSLNSPSFLRYWTMPEISFALGGNLAWDQKAPWEVRLDNLLIRMAMVEGTLNTQLDMRQGLLINKFDVDIKPIDINKVLSVLPADFKKEYSIPDGIETNVTVAIKGTLTEPFKVGGRSSIPVCKLNIDIPDATFRWQKVHFDNLAANIDVDIPGDRLNMIKVTMNRLNLRGPATDLNITGSVTSLMDDPLFDGTVKGVCELAKLPPVLSRYIPGYIRGKLTADARITGRPSMFDFTQYHRLKALGRLSVKDLYFVDSDTINMVYATRATFGFGTNRKSTSDGHAVDSLLRARVTVDSIAVLHSDLAFNAGRVQLDFGSVAKANTLNQKKGERRVVPMGGGVKIGSFRFLLLTDSVMTNLRDMNGSIVLSAHDNDMHTPQLRFNLDIRRFSAGDRTKRVMFRNAHTDLTAWREPQTRGEKRVNHIMDSLRRTRPDIPMDSIYGIALAIHQRTARHHRYPRVHPVEVGDSTEVIDFGTGNGMRRIFLGWAFKGGLTAERAGVFTPYFPLRNRFSNINLRFNNDSIIMKDVRYKCGQSDFTLSGVVSNMKRSLTSKRGRSPLRMNFDLASDTINVNQLAQTAFAGSAYQQAVEKKEADKMHMSLEADEERLEREIGRHVQDAPDSMAPFLVPTNVEATLKVRANNVLYSDLLLHDMTGHMMTYQGALSLNNLAARSDFGRVALQALYVGRQVDSLQFGFGMQVKDFNISRFLKLVPALDSVMPLLKDFGGIISADIAATTDISRHMDFEIPTMRAAIQLSGDSLVLLDPDTFKSLSKWLLFKDKKKNYIDHMSVQMLIEDGQMRLFPFMFNIDRYKLGVQGSNDFNLNFKYHIAVLKSPIPFKFGINISGNPDKYKIRLGGAKFNEKTPMTVSIVDTTRINLVNSLRSVFRRGVANARFKRLDVSGVTEAAAIDLAQDSLTHADSLQFIREGLIPAPDTTAVSTTNAKGGKRTKPAAPAKKKRRLFSLVGTLPKQTGARG